MRSSIIAFICIMLFSSAAFARDIYTRGHMQRGGKYGDPYLGAYPGPSRNDARPPQGRANQDIDQPRKKNPDPYDSRYNTRYGRPNY